MFYPKLAAGRQQTLTTEAFGGYDHNLELADGDFYDMENLSALYARPEYKGRLRVEAGSKPCVSLRIKAKGRVIDEARAFVREWGAEKAE